MSVKKLVSIVSVMTLVAVIAAVPAAAQEGAKSLAQPPPRVDLDRSHAPGQVVDKQGRAGWNPHEGS